MASIRVLAGDLSQFSGSAQYSEELALRLVKRGHDVSVVAFKATPRLRESCDTLEIGRSPHRNKALIWRFAFNLDQSHSARALRRAALAPIDIVLGLEHMLLRPHQRLFPKAQLVYVPLSLVAPIEIASYGLSAIPRRLGTSLFSKLQRWALRHAAVTVRFTRMSCQELDAYYGLGVARKYVVNPIAVPIPEEPVRPKHKGTTSLLWLGRVIEPKNAALAVSVLAGLREYPWRFDIVGDGEDLPRVKSLVESLNLTDRIHCHGRQPETAPWYRTADLALFTSKLDNCPLVVLEAMSHGVPVLAVRPDGKTYRSGIEELIDHGRTGFLGNGESGFGEELQRILSNPNWLGAIGNEARQHVAAYHSWDKHLDRYEETFEVIQAIKLDKAGSSNSPNDQLAASGMSARQT